jgi:hypothetical protein
MAISFLSLLERHHLRASLPQNVARTGNLVNNGRKALAPVNSDEQRGTTHDA